MCQRLCERPSVLTGGEGRDELPRAPDKGHFQARTLCEASRPQSLCSLTPHPLRGLPFLPSPGLHVLSQPAAAPDSLTIWKGLWPAELPLEAGHRLGLICRPEPSTSSHRPGRVCPSGAFRGALQAPQSSASSLRASCSRPPIHTQTLSRQLPWPQPSATTRLS